MFCRQLNLSSKHDEVASVIAVPGYSFLLCTHQLNYLHFNVPCVRIVLFQFGHNFITTYLVVLNPSSGGKKIHSLLTEMAWNLTSVKIRTAWKYFSI